MIEEKSVSIKNIVLFLILLSFVLFLHGAVPFFAVPTLGQAVWTAGFGQSFANQSGFAIYASNFGAPQASAIAFGLAGALPTGLFISIGFHPADAYALMSAIWLSISFFAAWRLSRVFNMRPFSGLIAAVLWMSTPIIWAHAGYSMVSLGMALLPFYFLMALFLLMKNENEINHTLFLKSIGFIIACLISVFMDGYTFMMFAAGTGLLGLYFFIRYFKLRRYLLSFAMPVYVVAFGLAYTLYALYIGKAQFAASPLGFFRGWGVDLTFLAIPTQGILWFWDAIGLSISRSSRDFFGDGSVWNTTFCLPITIGGVIAWWYAKKKTLVATGLLIVALFGLYMSLGPSLKINSIRPESMIETGQTSPMMPEDLAICSTGNALLYKNVPGFQNMRAAYRWMALSIFGFWLLIVLAMGRSRLYPGIIFLILVLLIIFNLPHIANTWETKVKYRDSFLNIDEELISDMEPFFKKGELLAFLPYRNDFLVNYIAARLDIKTFNIGGDKNLKEAMKYWPMSMRHFQMGKINEGFTKRVVSLLSRGTANAVVLPYIDMLWAAHAWPPPLKFKDELSPIVRELMNSENVDVKKRKYYTIVRFESGRTKQNTKEMLEYPIEVKNFSSEILSVLGSGWHELEKSHVWSGPEADLRLPVPERCRSDNCSAMLTLSVYGASEKRPVEVFFETKEEGTRLLDPITVRSSSLQKIRIPLSTTASNQVLSIKVPKAISPSELENSADARVLGVALHSIELISKEKAGSRQSLHRTDFSKSTTFTQVGAIKNRALVSTGESGFLLYGPYKSLKAGKYHLTVKGSASTIDSAWVDVVSEEGTIEHARFPVDKEMGKEKGILVSGNVTLEKSVQDLEVRVWVSKQDTISIDSYSIQPIN
ncbi:hypothetical protein HNR65_000318 [Desulfosalsimonas propionicica]|uniref:Uncharacterized protein n=1 Tax=Desulfosalsimonas propionicica TaxID=332175 RepID=A0A7W0HJE8_9BACT|nr:hypothetical protein [Desulfosalsimonas propionicica]MBA2880011.1 hypothetical protein [Desulfosalsimonas propionicica]